MSSVTTDTELDLHPGYPSKFKVLAEKSWTDPEPDTLTIAVCLDGSSGRAHVVFVGNAVWLQEAESAEVRAWLVECESIASAHNASM
jgi:hypothetical protein